MGPQPHLQPRHEHSERPLLPTKTIFEIDGGSWKPSSGDVAVTLRDADNPPPDWHISTPAPGHPGQRWYWLLLPLVLGIILGVFIYAHMPPGTREAVANGTRAVVAALIQTVV
jgi:hypothetical protein